MSEGSQATHYYLGSITGTSVDGLDLALIDLAVGVRLVAAATLPFPAPLRTALLTIAQPGNDDLDLIGETDAALGEFIGNAIARFLEEQGLTPGDVEAIGSHGQTIRHRPDGALPFTWQIGDPNRIAERTGITTVADFRRRDIAAGGQGAPLVPPFHEALFRSPTETRVVINIGGISNITLLPEAADQPLSGFDTGPGNGLLDAWCEQHTGQPFDRAGQWAAVGTISTGLLESMLGDPYLSRLPPKSTGREVFNLNWLETHRPERYAPVDVQRTLIEFTARTLIDAIEQWATPSDLLIVCGGGRLNDFLMSRLQALTTTPVRASEAMNQDGDAIEAAAFAWLAAQRLAARSGNAEAVTGATGPRVLGAVYHGNAGGI